MDSQPQSKNSPHAERQPRESEVSALLRGTSLELIVQKKLEQFVPQPDTYALRDLYHTVMESVERPLITCILNRTAGNQCRAAEILGINRNTLRKKMQALGITTNERRRAS